MDTKKDKFAFFLFAFSVENAAVCARKHFSLSNPKWRPEKKRNLTPLESANYALVFSAGIGLGIGGT